MDGPRRICPVARTAVNILSAIDQQTWRLIFESQLRADTGARSASPGSKGRLGAGYGGFFWRFPACDNVEVYTAETRGEDEVHGSAAPWIAWSADFTAGPGLGGPATIVIAAPGSATAAEPWFVRVRDYPGIGLALPGTVPLSFLPR